MYKRQVYDLIADEDIYTGDGTLRVAKDTVVATPVSYTHLDVYKRQTRISGREQDFDLRQARDSPDSLEDLSAKARHTRQPVSYTHLVITQYEFFHFCY